MKKDNSKTIFINVSELELDPNNYRLARYGATSNEGDLIKLLWKAENTREIADSIQAIGYIDGDPIVVSLTKSNTDRHIVLEGNRRVTALKVLSSKELRERLEIKYDVGDYPIPTRIPVRIFDDPALVQQYLGIRHLKGPKTWDPYGKAKYIAHLLEEEHYDLERVRKEVGDKSNKTVIKQYIGFKILRQAEEGLSYNKENSFGRFNFSHLYEALQQDTFRKFLDVSDEDLRSNNHPIKKNKLWKLRKLLIYLFGDKTHGVKKVISSQNPDLKYLGLVLTTPKAAKVFENTGDFKKSVLILTPQLNKKTKPKVVKIIPEIFELISIPKDFNWPPLSLVVNEMILLAKHIDNYPIATACLLRCIMEEAVKVTLVKAQKYNAAITSYRAQNESLKNKEPGLAFLLTYLCSDEVKGLIQKPVLSGLADWKGFKPTLDNCVHGGTILTSKELRGIGRKIEITLSKMLNLQTLLITPQLQYENIK